jgi:amino acid transporter
MALEVRLSREMRLVDVTMIGVGAMIGAGIFVLTGIAAGVAGPALLVVFGLNGLVALLSAAAYAELGGAIHGAGGGYLWIKRSLPDPSGFLAGWMDWFAHAVACSLYALGFGAYCGEVLDLLGIPEIHPPLAPLEVWLAVGACTLFSYINYRGASETGKAGNVVTIGKVVIIGAFVVAGLWTMGIREGWQASFTPFMPSGWTGIFAAMGLTFIAFEGYEIIAQTSEEVENPKHNVPRAVFLSLFIVVPIYLLVAFVAIGAVTPPPGMSVTQYLGEQKEIALVRAAEQFVTGGALVILVGGLLSTLSALNATIYSSSRVAFAMARDASLPQVVARVHRERATPHVAILFSALLIIVMAVALPIEDVAAAASVMFLLLFGGVNVALIRLRRLHPELDRGFKVPLVPFTPILAILAMLFLAGFMLVDYPLAGLAAGGWIAAGCAFYYAYSRKRETAFEERVTWMERIERREYRVLVAISSPRTMESLLESAMAIARQHDGELVVVTVAEVPEGETLFSGRRQVRELEPVLEAAVRYAEERGIEVRPVIKIARRIGHGLAQTAREEGCNFLVIGQPSSQSFFERLVASIVERVLQDAPCHVAVVYGGVDRDRVSRIVVPVTRGGNSKLAAELATPFSHWFEAPIRALTVVERAAAGNGGQEQAEKARETLRAAGSEVELEVLLRAETNAGLLRNLKRGELVLIGAPSSGPVVPLFGDTIPALIAKRGRNPVVVVRHVEELRARRFERLFFARS